MGSSFSMPMTVISVSGSVRHIRPLPSDSTTMTVPVSAIAKFAPDTATRARRNFSRRWQPGGLGERPRLVGQVVRGGPAGGRHLAPEDVPDLGAVAVDRRHEDVRGQVVAQLDDQLREVGLPGGDALPARAPR